MNITTIKRTTIGTRTNNGTGWGVEHLAQRHEYSGKVEWVLVKYLSNGVCDGSETFTTKRALVARFNEMTGEG